jgi:large subunit ribosomal protein L35
MPKAKSRKSVTKRFRLTRTGKVVHRSAFNRHLARKKNASHKRRLRQSQTTGGRLGVKIAKVLR